MHSGWQILDFSNFSGSLKYRRGQLIAKNHETDEVHELPLEGIAIILIGNAVSVSGAVLSKLSDYDVALLVCSWNGIPTAGAFPWSSHTRIGARQIAQASLSLPKRKRAWAKIVTAKISGQGHVLQAFDLQTEATHLFKLAKKVRSGDPDNLEAQAARYYWSKIPTSQSFFRSPGSGMEYNNALDYGYTILRGTGIRALTAAGLVGTLGIFHHGRSNSFSLADDLMEPFRPLVDFCVFHDLEPEPSLSRESKHILVSACNGTFDSSGKTVSSRMIELAQSFGLYVEGEDASILKIPIWERLPHA